MKGVMVAKLGSFNVQAIVPAETHKTLRDVAYERGVPLRDLLKMVLVEFAEKHKNEVGSNTELTSHEKE